MSASTGDLHRDDLHRDDLHRDDLHRAVAGRLADHDQQYTSNRRAVVEALATAGSPISLPDLLAIEGSLAQSSAYRCLATLVELGIVRRLVHVGDHALFELDEHLTEHHHHLICEECGAVTDVTLPDAVERAMDRAFDAAAAEAGFASTHHAVDIYGACADCRASADRASADRNGEPERRAVTETG